MNWLKTHRGIASTLILVVLCTGLYFVAPGFRGTAINVLEWVNDIGYWAPVAFAAITIIGVVFLLPGFLFTLGAGFIFGFVEGVLLVWVATNLGAIMAFLIGRHTIETSFSKYLNKQERIKQVNEVLRQKGWKTIMFTRMIPFFPFKLSNYVFGMAGYSIKDFCLGTAIGILPITILNVYIGSMAGTLTELGAGNQPTSLLQWAIYVSGFAILCIAIVYLAKIGRSTLNLK